MSDLKQKLVDAGALRQFRHNDASEGLVIAYDYEVTNRILASAAQLPRVQGGSIDTQEFADVAYAFLDTAGMMPEVTDDRYMKLVAYIDAWDARRAAVPDVEFLLSAMTSEQRMGLFGEFCWSCGDKNPRCQCWNDE